IVRFTGCHYCGRQWTRAGSSRQSVPGRSSQAAQGGRRGRCAGIVEAAGFRIAAAACERACQAGWRRSEFVNRLFGPGTRALAAAFLLGACVSPRRQERHQPAAAASVGSAGAGLVEGYAAAIKAASDRSDHEADAKSRADLATEATNNADACLAV